MKNHLKKGELENHASQILSRINDSQDDGDWKDSQKRRCSLIREAARFRLMGETTYPQRRAIGLMLKRMPDGGDCPRAFLNWFEANWKRIPGMLA